MSFVWCEEIGVVVCGEVVEKFDVGGEVVVLDVDVVCCLFLYVGF